MLWPEEEKGQNEEGEDGGPFRLRMYLSFAFVQSFLGSFLSSFLCHTFFGRTLG